MWERIEEEEGEVGEREGGNGREHVGSEEKRK